MKGAINTVTRRGRLWFVLGEDSVVITRKDTGFYMDRIYPFGYDSWKIIRVGRIRWALIQFIVHFNLQCALHIKELKV